MVTTHRRNHATTPDRAADRPVVQTHYYKTLAESFLDTFFERYESNHLIRIRAMKRSPAAIIDNKI
jgi:hypothetical protein